MHRPCITVPACTILWVLPHTSEKHSNDSSFILTRKQLASTANNIQEAPLSLKISTYIFDYSINIIQFRLKHTVKNKHAGLRAQHSCIVL